MGAANWPELNVARINFALIGKKGSAVGTGMYSHKLRTTGPVKIEACLSTTTLEVKCLEGEFFSESTC